MKTALLAEDAPGVATAIKIISDIPIFGIVNKTSAYPYIRLPNGKCASSVGCAEHDEFMDRLKRLNIVKSDSHNETRFMFLPRNIRLVSIETTRQAFLKAKQNDELAPVIEKFFPSNSRMTFPITFTHLGTSNGTLIIDCNPDDYQNFPISFFSTRSNNGKTYSTGMKRKIAGNRIMTLGSRITSVIQENFDEDTIGKTVIIEYKRTVDDPFDNPHLLFQADCRHESNIVHGEWETLLYQKSCKQAAESLMERNNVSFVPSRKSI